MSAIEVKNLKKSYGKVRALAGISFNVKEGEVFGLLGPNGAGKTTALEILEGLRQADTGEAKILGLDYRKNRREIEKKIGVVLQDTDMLPNLTIRELLELYVGFYSSAANIDELTDRFELGDLQSRYYHDLSGGQKQRFILALAILHRPEVLFLDEPTIGLDPQVRQRFWEIIKDLQKQGLTILITTHYMDEAQILCDRVGIIDHGKILVSDRPVKLINDIGVISKIKFMSSKPINVAGLEALPGVISARKDRYSYDLETETPEESLRTLLEWEKQFSGKIFNLQVNQATLEDVFLKLTGRSLRE